MNAKVLVGYATRSGSTKEVAVAIGARLRESGIDSEVKLLKEVTSLEGYRSVVIGAPLYMFRWHKDAMRFLSRHRASLEKRAAAVFALGPTNEKEKEFLGAREQLDKELAKFPWFAPFAREVFGGKFEPATLRFPMTLIPALKKLPASDIRDWDAIRGWASQIARKL
jgi:menaquinone-dependent protoporphyrinogen oxidase